jgi:hypothetical protein
MATKPMQRTQYPMTFKDAVAALLTNALGAPPKMPPQSELPTVREGKKSA